MPSKAKPAHSAPRSEQVQRADTLWGPIVGNAFEEIGISVTLRSHEQWFPIHTRDNVIQFELEHSAEKRRVAYNGRCLRRTTSRNEVLIGRHAGFSDLFVPVGQVRQTQAIVVAGPFATERPTSDDVRARWRSLTGRRPHVTDAAFLHYLSTSLATPTLDPTALEEFTRLLSCFARLLAGELNPSAIAAEAAVHRSRLVATTFVQRNWLAARSMIDRRTTHTWTTPYQAEYLTFLGLSRVPEHVVVVFTQGRQDTPDPIDELIRRDGFQRACVELAHKFGGAISGPVGDHGAVFLVEASGSASRRRTRLVDLASRATALARRFGFSLHAGLSRTSDRTSIAAQYETALSAAEKALVRGVSIEDAEATRPHSSVLSAELGRALADTARERPALLSASFDRYSEAVAVHSGYRLEATRVKLESGLARIAESLLESGALDARSFDEIGAALERASASVSTVRELLAAYRKAIADIETILLKPTAARRDRGTQRVLDFIAEHLGEPLALSRVARVAGFAPSYFSKLFKRQEGVTFEQYLRRVRIVRAQQMLDDTPFSVERIGRLAGFRTRHHFHAVFKEVVGITPRRYRHRAGGTFAERAGYKTK